MKSTTVLVSHLLAVAVSVAEFENLQTPVVVCSALSVLVQISLDIQRRSADRRPAPQHPGPEATCPRA
ncbi:hypothetical protein EDD30_0214 [Couchioplanes caeruleus]|uniref:Uncharacterized protein n=1 Tax=Couchioplanes caeruleus TaxID=56438 RepID=A0A3N1GBD2_9ACTN|nr:hypothetical protein EDD30_0214 [Couchioplanes caeruleus]